MSVPGAICMPALRRTLQIGSRPRTSRGPHRCSRAAPPSAPELLQLAVELRRGEKRRCRLHDLVRSQQLTNLSFELVNSLRLGGCDARSVALVDLDLLNPVAQRLGIEAQLLTHT